MHLLVSPPQLADSDRARLMSRSVRSGCWWRNATAEGADGARDVGALCVRSDGKGGRVRGSTAMSYPVRTAQGWVAGAGEALCTGSGGQDLQKKRRRRDEVRAFSMGNARAPEFVADEGAGKGVPGNRRSLPCCCSLPSPEHIVKKRVRNGDRLDRCFIFRDQEEGQSGRGGRAGGTWQLDVPSWHSLTSVQVSDTLA